MSETALWRYLDIAPKFIFILATLLQGFTFMACMCVWVPPPLGKERQREQFSSCIRSHPIAKVKVYVLIFFQTPNLHVINHQYTVLQIA